MRWMWQAHSGSISATCARLAVAWGLLKMRLLWLSVGRSRLDLVHQRQLNAVQERLLEAVWQHRVLRRLQQSHSGFRDGNAGTKQRLSLGMFCMSAVQSQVNDAKFSTPKGGNWFGIQLLLNNLNKMQKKFFFTFWFPIWAIKTTLRKISDFASVFYALNI